MMVLHKSLHDNGPIARNVKTDIVDATISEQTESEAASDSNYIQENEKVSGILSVQKN